MATNATAQYWIRVNGSNTNAGSYDSGIAGAATNYCDQDAAQASWSTLTLSSGTLTDAGSTGLFTAAMIGNAVNVPGQGYYWITARTNSNVVTVLVGTNAATSFTTQPGKVGGALANVAAFSTGGTVATPETAVPLVPGNIVNIRGSGSNTPSSPDYVQTGYSTFPSGDGVNGLISWIGYNGRPFYEADGLLFYNTSSLFFSNIKVGFSDGATNYGIGIINGANYFSNCVFDQGGQDMQLIGGAVYLVSDCEFTNSGSASVGTSYAISGSSSYPVSVIGNTFSNLRGFAYYRGSDGAETIMFNLIYGCNGTGSGAITKIGTGNDRGSQIVSNTIDNCSGDGIKILSADAATVIMNNILSNNGGYGLNFVTGSAALNLALRGNVPNYNNYYNNTSGAYNNISAGPNDLALDPQYVNASGGNYSIGTNLKAKGFPGAFRGSATTGYLDIGAVQRQEQGGGGGCKILSSSIIQGGKL